MSEVPLLVDDFGLRYRRGGPWAVRGVTASLPPGSVTALVGPNGAGKSTLLRSCLGFERPTRGRILVCGIDPRDDPGSAIENIGYVPQSGALYRNLTITEHFVMAREARRSFDVPYALARIIEAGLQPKRPVGELSGGEAAQVALAIALGTRAPLLVLDEPLASLDPLARRDFLVVLVDHVRRGGATALLASHIVSDVEHACDRILVLGGGRLVLDTSIADARATFSVAAADRGEPIGAIGLFAGPSGETLALTAWSEVGRPASLEEIVLGHLAAGRSRAAEGRPT